MMKIWTPIVVVCLTAAVNCATIGYEYSMMSSLNILDVFTERFNITASRRGLLTAIANVGSIAGSFIAGSIVDRFGRKGGILASASLALVACILLSTANTHQQFFVGRVVVGISKSIDVASVPTYLVEMAPPKYRGLVAGFYWTCWLLGAIIAAAVGYGARSIGGDMSWRTICIIMAAPAASCIVLLAFIPESPRFLIGRDRSEEALTILAKYHGDGDTTNPLVVAEFREIRDTIAYEQAHQYATWGAWWKEFNNRANHHRFFVLISLGVFEQTVGSSIITFYIGQVLELAGITSESQKFGINIGQNCVAFVSALVGILLLDKVGRIPMLIFGSSFCAAVLACMAGLTSSQIDNLAGRNGVIAMVFLFQFGYSSTWTPISFSYCAEILNFTVRAKGMAFYNFFTSSTGFINQYIIPIGLASIRWKFYIIGVCWNVFMVVVISCTYVETKGLTLEQISQRFEGVKHKDIVDVVVALDGNTPLKLAEIGEAKVPVVQEQSVEEVRDVKVVESTATQTGAK